MKKLFCGIGSLFCILVGVKIFVFTSIANKIILKIGLLVFNYTVSGVYSPSDYKIDFTFVNGIAVILVISGVILGIYSVIKDKGTV